MFRVTVNGETKDWMTLEYALTDALSRGLGRTWILERVADE